MEMKIILCFLMFFLFGILAQAEYEAIKNWDEDLICFPVSILGKRGDPIRLKWSNFLTFDENSKMVFLKLDKGLHTVPSRGFVCMPEDSVDDLWPEGE